MCGIAGIVGRRAPERLQTMTDTIAHRGPDDEGREWIETGDGTWIGLGNRRLAIIDLSPAGHLPMRVDDDYLAYNGEIYNFQSLRDDPAIAGERFFSSTDTEVVLRLLREGGTSALRKLNGMFGLAWWNPREQELVVARDRFGIKPLYYCRHEGELLFASEAKALLAAGFPARMNADALASYLSFGWVPGNETLFEGISELAPGALLRWRDGDFTVEQFHDTRPCVDESMTAEDAALELRTRLEDSVRRQLIADVPVGVLLSGGLDSSAIAALAAARSEKPVKAYSITFREEDARTEQSGQDADFARLVSRHLGLELQEFEIGPEIAGLADDVAWHLDEPLADPAAILTLLICRHASNDVKVLLSGQGSDELFGGYRVHLYDSVAQPLGRLPGGVTRALGAGLDVVPRLAGSGKVPGAGLMLAAHRSLDMIVRNAQLPQERRYVAFRNAPYFSEDAAAGLIGRGGFRPYDHHLGAFDEVRGAGFFDRMLYVDFKTFLVNQNLLYSDRLSMAASIEMRVPFLDDAVADFALAAPRRLKVRKMRGKQVLRDALEGVVPAPVIARRKAGFGAPIRAWLRDELRPVLQEAVVDSPFTRAGVVERGPVETLVDEHVSGRADHTYRLWSLVALSLWQKAHGVSI